MNDRNSMGNLCQHAVKCWGEEAINAACAAINVLEVHEKIIRGILKNSLITTHFQCKASEVTYSACQHTCTETCVKIVKWVAESLQLFCIITDPGFKMLMKTGCLGYHLLSPSTVVHDVKEVFMKTRSHVAQILQVSINALREYLNRGN